MLGEPGHGKSSLCIKMVSNFRDFRDRRFYSDKIKKVFSFSLNPTTWIKESKNLLDVKNIFILPHKQIMVNGKYQDIILGEEYLKESLIFLDGYDELYLRLQESPKGTILFLEDLKNLAKSWNLKIVITSRKTCINPAELHEDGYKICRLAKLTKDKQKEWINSVYNTKLFPENPYDIEKMYSSYQENNTQSKVFELLEIPILLQLIVSNYFYDAAQNIVELHNKLFKRILDTRKIMTINSYDENRIEEFKQIFESYAYNIYKNNDTYAIIKSEELKEKENTKWKSLLLFYIKSTKSTRQEEYHVEFVHRSFYQYFQAWYFYNLILEIIKEKEKNTKEKKIVSLFEAIHWKKIEIDVIDMIKQINHNQEQIQNQEQINYILDIFKKTDGSIKKEKNSKWHILIRKTNILDKVEIIVYNLLMILNIILPNGLILSKSKSIKTLMKKCDMSKIYLPKIVFSNLNLVVAHLERANLEEANLEEANLEKTNLEGTNLEGTNLKKANLKKANLKKANLEWTDLGLANLEQADLRGDYLKGINLKNTNLERANLKEANLRGADLEGAHLENADLEGAHLERAILIGANLKGAHLENAIFDPIILRDAILKNTKISIKRYDAIFDLGIDVNKIIWYN